MRKSLLVSGLAMLCLSFIFPAQGYTQLLSWSSSYSPSWANGNISGTATNVSSSGVNCTTAVSISGGSFTLALGGSGAQTPTVSGGTFTVPGSTARLQVTTNFSSNANYSDIVMTFSAFVTNVSFRIVDIDKNTPGSTTYFDRVTITGSNGSTTLNATITKYVMTRVTDATGRIVQSAIRTLYKGNNNISISNLTKLNPGVYIIEVFDEERKSLGISRLIKN